MHGSANTFCTNNWEHGIWSTEWVSSVYNHNRMAPDVDGGDQDRKQFGIQTQTLWFERRERESTSLPARLSNDVVFGVAAIYFVVAWRSHSFIAMGLCVFVCGGGGNAIYLSSECIRHIWVWLFNLTTKHLSDESYNKIKSIDWSELYLYAIVLALIGFYLVYFMLLWFWIV